MIFTEENKLLKLVLLVSLRFIIASRSSAVIFLPSALALSGHPIRILSSFPPPPWPPSVTATASSSLVASCFLRLPEARGFSSLALESACVCCFCCSIDSGRLPPSPAPTTVPRGCGAYESRVLKGGVGD